VPIINKSHLPTTSTINNHPQNFIVGQPVLITNQPQNLIVGQPIVITNQPGTNNNWRHEMCDLQCNSECKYAYLNANI
jgi:hypothetical protein